MLQGYTKSVVARDKGWTEGSTNCKGHKETFEIDGNSLYFACGDGFTDNIYLSGH